MPIAQAFRNEVRAVRETMAVASATIVAEPPADLRAPVLGAVKPELNRQSHWYTTVLAEAVAIVVGMAAFGVGVAPVANSDGR